MAFRRLVVERSPGLAWFGVVMLVSVYGWTKTYHHSYATMVTHGHVLGWGFLHVVALYCVFRGIHGAWHRELRIDRDARMLKTMLGTIVPFDRIGALRIENHELRADGVGTMLYLSPYDHDLELRRDALEAVLGRGGSRPRVHRLRRLAYHRSPALFVFTLIGFALLAAAVIGNIIYGGSDELEYKLLAAVGLAISVLWFRRALFGSFSSDQLFVDVPAGLLQLEDGRLRRFDELGALSIDARKPAYTGRRHALVDYDLRAANLDKPLFSSSNRAHTQLRLDALATAMLAYQLRQALELVPDTAETGTAYRDAPDMHAAIDRIAGGSPHRAAALAELTRDPDPAIRRQASSALQRPR